MDVKGKTVLVTGATGGLGRAIARALAACGATVVLSSRKGAELEALAASLDGEDHRFVVADLAQAGAGEELIAAAGEIDGLVANAGLSAGGRLEAFTDEELVTALHVNLEAPVRMAHALLPALVERGEGHMVFIGSLQSKAALPRSSVYSATKFGLRGFALSLREDARESGVGVSLVLPGFIRDAGIFADSGAKVPAGMGGTSSPEEVGEGVVEAIERDRAEVQVAPLLQRLGTGIAHRNPQLAARVSGARAAKAAEEVIDGHKRGRGQG
jgi:short-subunit dehydrogenase